MNRIAAICLMAIIALCARAESRMLLDSILTTDEFGPTELTVYEYNGQGVATYSYLYLAADSGWALNQTNQLAELLDQQGRVVTVNRSLLTDGNWILMSRINYEYDADGRLAAEVAQSRSAWGQTWNNMYRYRYIYADGVVDTIYYELWDTDGWLEYITLVRVAGESTPACRVMDRFWTGYESEGTDGQMLFYYSEHEVAAALTPASADAAPRKIWRDGRILIRTAHGTYTLLGQTAE